MRLPFVTSPRVRRFLSFGQRGTVKTRTALTQRPFAAARFALVE
jgi:hypothetical protein